MNILLVGQIYLDTILHVDKFPEEDSKIRANSSEQRIGGNTYNTAAVLSQFKQLNVCYMSAVGSRETSNHIIDTLDLNHLDDTILFRDNKLTPFSIIIHHQKASSRTIISNHDIKELDLDEFVSVFNKLNETHPNCWWVHFEGRNISETIRQIDWLDNKATLENWRNRLIISVEIEKPERENITLLAQKGDVLFFSKIFAQHYQFNDAASFLSNSNLNLKKKALAFCTWGSKDAAAFHHSTGQLYLSTPPIIDQVIDTVGAGDTFNAGIISQLAQSFDIHDALNFACHLATKKVSQQGFDNLC